MTNHVHARTTDHVLTLTLARPEKRNALTQEMYAALGAALRAADADDDVRCVVVQAEGDTFCAGNDLGDFAAVGDATTAGDDGLDPVLTNPLLTALPHLRTPLVAAVQGPAVGIGTTLLLHCDLVLLADDAVLAAPFVELGLVPEAASSHTLPARIGHPRAFAMFALGQRVTAPEALAWGLANAVVPRAELHARAAELAAQVAARSPDAVQATKALMRDGEALATQIAREAPEFTRRLRSPETQATIAALRAGARR